MTEMNSPADLALAAHRALTSDSTLDDCRAAKHAIDQAWDARIRADMRVYSVTSDEAIAAYLETDEGLALMEAAELVEADIHFLARDAEHAQATKELQAIGW